MSRPQASDRGDALHIVDVERVDGFEKGLTLGQCASLDLAGLDAADTHLYPLAIAKAALEYDEFAAGKGRGGRQTPQGASG
jgi:hypothetical protein